jgi:hypothetical protein
VITLSAGVDGVTMRLPDGARVTVDADQAQNLGNELLNSATAVRIARSRAAHPSNNPTNLTRSTR